MTDLEELPPSLDRVFRFSIAGIYLRNQGMDHDMGEIGLDPGEYLEESERAPLSAGKSGLAGQSCGPVSQYEASDLKVNEIDSKIIFLSNK